MKKISQLLLVAVSFCVVLTAQYKEGNFLDLTRDIPDQKGTTTGGRSESIISPTHQPEQDIAPI